MTSEVQNASAPYQAKAAELRAAFDACRTDITARINQAKSSSEAEVVAIGDSINKIVDLAKEYVAHVEDRMRRQAASEAQTAAMVKEMVAAVHRQDEAVEKATAQSSSILRAGKDVQAMASATRLLSLNARVEASRLGDQGSSFSVIADEMRQLSHAVQQTNGTVASMAKELERTLPQISEQARIIHAQFEKFTKHVEIQLKGKEEDSQGESGKVVERIMEMAYEALSHLAFQDPMVQSLHRIHTSLDRVQPLVDSLDGSEESTAAARAAVEAAAPVEEEVDVEAGEVMLF